MNKKRKIILCITLFVLSVVFASLCIILFKNARGMDIIDYKTERIFGVLMVGVSLSAVCFITSLVSAILVYAFVEEAKW